MPPRTIIALIVVFWVGVTSWAAWRTLAPYLRPNDPPPFVIDLADESGQQTIFWKIIQGKTEVGVAESEVRQDANGLFLIGCRYKMRLARGVATAEVHNRYHVSGNGDLRGLSAEIRLGYMGNNEFVKGLIEGPIQEASFIPHGEFEFLGEKQKVRFDPVDMGKHKTVVNPLHPVNRITGLKAGRTWQVPVFDPLVLVSSAEVEGKANPLVTPVLELLKSQHTSTQFRELSAQVLPDAQSLYFQGRQELCWVIEYHEGKLSAKTWVRQKDGLVLMQEAKMDGDNLMLVRIPSQ